MITAFPNQAVVLRERPEVWSLFVFRKCNVDHQSKPLKTTYKAFSLTTLPKSFRGALKTKKGFSAKKMFFGAFDTKNFDTFQFWSWFSLSPIISPPPKLSSVPNVSINRKCPQIFRNLGKFLKKMGTSNSTF